MGIEEMRPRNMGYTLPVVSHDAFKALVDLSVSEFTAELDVEREKNPRLSSVTDMLVDETLSILSREGARHVSKAEEECRDGAHHAIILFVMQAALEAPQPPSPSLPLFEKYIVDGFRATYTDEYYGPRNRDRFALAAAAAKEYRTTNPQIENLATLVTDKYRSRTYSPKALAASRGVLHMTRLIQMQGESNYIRDLVGPMEWWPKRRKG